MRSFKYILFGFLLFSFFGVQQYLPALQQLIPKWQVEELGGSRFSDKRPNYWPWAWLDGSFQDKYQRYLKNENKVISSFVRFNTQFNFDVFGVVTHEDILMGKDNYLMPKSSWIAYSGRDFIGEEQVKEQVDQLKVIDDYLQESGKRLLILTPPNKSTAMTEYLPAFYRDYPVTDKNWNSFKKEIQKQNLDLIAFEYCIGGQEKSPYPIYPQGGLHWTYYGYSLAADTIHNYIENQFGWDIPDMDWKDNIELKEMQRLSDTELYATANFLKVPKLDLLPYPQIKYDRDSSQLLKVLAVGDSYYKLLYDYGIHNGLFDKDSPFWYYASTLFPPVYRNGKKLNNSGDLDVLEILENKDLVILTVVEGNLKTFSWGWVKRAYEAIQMEKESANN